MTKMTYAQAIDIALETVVDEMAREKLEALKSQLAKRGTGKKTPTKTQKEKRLYILGKILIRLFISNLKLKSKKKKKKIKKKKKLKVKMIKMKKQMILIIMVIILIIQIVKLSLKS